MKTTTTATATGLPRLGGLALLALLLLGPCAGAAPAMGPAPAGTAAAVVPVGPVVFADGFSLKGFFSGMGSRTRVVQLCVVTMCLALFIMMRKFTAGGGR
jgi:hypothetical protein